MDPIRVSVVIPTYNHAKYVGAAVESALAQTHPPLEVIVVDDGSTDDTEERMRGSREPVRYIRQANRGVCAARNRGIAEARGDYVALLDADDLWLPVKLERQADVARRKPGAGLYATAGFLMDERGERQEWTCEVPPPGQIVEADPLEILQIATFSPSSVMIPRATFERVGTFDEELSGSADLEMWVRIGIHAPLVVLTDQLSGIRVTPGSMSSKPDLMLADHRRVIEKLFSTWPALRERPRWRRIAEARMYKDLARIRYAIGDRRGAFKDVLRSVGRWPFAMLGVGRRKVRLERVRLLVRIGFLSP